MLLISLIAAIDRNNAIGKSGDMLCYLPSDLARFKAITIGHSIIMGRKTFESLPNGALPGRRNIVISRNTKLQLSGCEVVGSLQEAIAVCQSEEEVFIIGGGEIYKQAIDIADKLYITHIQHSFNDADTFFSEIHSRKWNKVHEELIKADGNNVFDSIFIIYEKRLNE